MPKPWTFTDEDTRYYAAEGTLWLVFRDVEAGREYPKLAHVRKFVGSVVTHPDVTKRFGDLAIEVRGFRTSDGPPAYSKGHTVYFHPAVRTQGIILHEVAHQYACWSLNERMSHGPVWIGVFHYLLTLYYTDDTPDKLLAACTERGVAYTLIGERYG